MHVDERIALLAEAQAGVISRVQALDAGLGRGAIAHRLRSGSLRRLLRGTYAVGHRALPRDAPLWAAVLACGDGWGAGVALARGSSAAHLELLRSRPGRVQLLTWTRGDGMAGVDLRRTGRIHPEDVVSVRGIPTTSAERTIVELCASGSRRKVEVALNQAEVLRLLDYRRLCRTMARLSKAPGMSILRDVLPSLDAPSSATTSWLQERLLVALRRAGVPEPWAEYEVLPDHHVDLAWPQARLAVETDGRAAHLTSHAFEEDRRRDAALVRAGWRVLRFTHRQVSEDAGAVVDTIARVLVGEVHA